MKEHSEIDNERRFINEIKCPDILVRQRNMMRDDEDIKEWYRRYVPQVTAVCSNRQNPIALHHGSLLSWLIDRWKIMSKYCPQFFKPDSYHEDTHNLQRNFPVRFSKVTLKDNKIRDSILKYGGVTAGFPCLSFIFQRRIILPRDTFSSVLRSGATILTQHPNTAFLRALHCQPSQDQENCHESRKNYPSTATLHWAGESRPIHRFSTTRTEFDQSVYQLPWPATQPRSPMTELDR